MNGTSRRCLLLALLLLTAGCFSKKTVPDNVVDDRSAKRIELREFLLRFTNRIEQASDLMVEQRLGPEIDRNAVYWKMGAVGALQGALRRADDQIVALDFWLLCAAMKRLFETEKAKKLFGDAASFGLEAAQEQEVAARALASSLLTEEQFAAADEHITKFVEEHVDEQDFKHSAAEDRVWLSSMSAILQKPLHVLTSPFSGLNPTSGLSDTAVAVHRVAGSFDLARTDLEFMPRQLRWQAQLLLLELEENLDFDRALEGIGELGESAKKIADTVETLPAALHTEASGLLDELDAKHTDLRATLKQAEDAVAQFDETLEETQATAAALEKTSTALTETFTAFSVILDQLDSHDEDQAPEDEGPPFDINDWGRTADKLTETTAALTTLLEEFRGLTDSDVAPRILGDTEAAARSVVDRAFVAAGLLAVFVCVLVLATRAGLARIGR